VNTIAAGSLGDPIDIRFDGLDADDHLVEMSDLASSLKGLSRIMTVAGTFATNQKLVERSKARPVRVMVGPPKDGCLIVQATMTWLDQHAFVASTVSGTVVLLIGYIFKKAANQREEMKELRGALDTAIKALGHRDEPLVGRLLDTIDRMADILKPAVKQAVAPIGRSAGTMAISGHGGGGPRVVVDKAERDAIYAEEPLEIGDESMILVRFTEMNLEARTCRIALDDDSDERYPADITDPEIMVPESAYAQAFSKQAQLLVRAKPTLRDGIAQRWYISGYSNEPG